MTNTKTITITRTLIVLVVLIFAELMPYLSRIPLSFVYGTAWIWKHTSTLDDFLRWNGLHLLTLIPIGVFGLIFIYGNQKLPFIASALGHFAVTCLIYYSHGEPPHNDDFLGCIAYPLPIGFAAGFTGAVALLGQTAFAAIKRRSAADKTDADQPK